MINAKTLATIRILAAARVGVWPVTVHRRDIVDMLDALETLALLATRSECPECGGVTSDRKCIEYPGEKPTICTGKWHDGDAMARAILGEEE